MKRKSTTRLYRDNKRPRRSLRGRIDKIDSRNWTSASSLHNYMLNDPCIDWIKHVKQGRGRSESTSSIKITDFKENSSNFCIDRTLGGGIPKGLGPIIPEEDKNEEYFYKFITNKGNEFEQGVMKILTNRLGLQNVKQISYSQFDIPKISKFEETVKALKAGVPIIYQGVLHDPERRTCGSPDLIVRSDYINKLTSVPGIEQNEINIKGPKLRGRYHYRIIDIKYHTMSLTSDGKHLINTGRMNGNKGQIILYSQMLGKVQGYTPSISYVLGRGWEYKKGNEKFRADTFDDRLGQIDTLNKDSLYLEKIERALEWLEDLRNEGHKWIVYPEPSRWELYPNMSNTNDAPYRNIKKQMAEDLEEITLIWNVGVKHRDNAHAHGITKWSDPNLNTEIMGINGPFKSRIIDRILDFKNGRLGKNQLVIPKYVTNNELDWQSSPVLEFYIDFETVSNIFDDMSQLPRIGCKQWVFMIGLTSVDNQGNIEYYNFTANKLNKESEYKIFNDMHKTITNLCNQHNIDIENTNFYHWGRIERIMYEDILNKHDCPLHWKMGNLCDFFDIFKKEAILIRDVMDFKLKSIGKGLMSHGLISKDNWYSDDMNNGLQAMIQAERCYKNKGQVASTGIKYPDNILKFTEIQSIIKYNEIDCRMVYEIINYLRNNHTRSFNKNELEEQEENPELVENDNVSVTTYESDDESDNEVYLSSIAYRVSQRRRQNKVNYSQFF